jgi:threonine dehydratase
MPAVFDAVNSQTIARCDNLIRPHIRRTPVVEINAADFGLDDRSLTIKLELLQHSGSFKVRGAFTNLLSRPVPAAGVVAASGGNHGAAVAYAAMKLGVPAKIFVPTVSSPAKIQRIRQYGADLVIEGNRYADALAASEAWVQKSGALPVHAYDQDETIIGQGTLALELKEAANPIDTVLVAVGGGGLIAGIAGYYAGRVKVVGVEPVGAATLARALEVGRPVDVDVSGLAADSLGARRIGERVFPIASRYVERVVLVTDEAIRGAQAALWQILRIVAEPGGAAAFSAILAGAYKPEGNERIAIIVSGGNTTAVNFNS